MRGLGLASANLRPVQGRPWSECVLVPLGKWLRTVTDAMAARESLRRLRNDDG
jgi:hypothetical protein